MPTNPSERYTANLTTETAPSGRLVYSSARPIEITTTSTDRTIIVGDSDRLDIIANNVYGSPEEWWRIALANNIVNGSLKVKPGTVLILPGI